MKIFEKDAGHWPTSMSHYPDEVAHLLEVDHSQVSFANEKLAPIIRRRRAMPKWMLETVCCIGWMLYSQKN
jgi:hypothetical protein